MIDGRMSGLMSKKIATITRYVPLEETIEDCRLGDMQGAMEIFERLQLKSLMTRLRQLSGSAPAADAPAARSLVWQDEMVLESESAVFSFDSLIALS